MTPRIRKLHKDWNVTELKVGPFFNYFPEFFLIIFFFFFAYEASWISRPPLCNLVVLFRGFRTSSSTTPDTRLRTAGHSQPITPQARIVDVPKTMVTLRG